MSIAAASAAVSCLIVRELSSQAFSVTLTRLTDVLIFMSRKPDDMTRAIHDEMVKLVPSDKLKIIQCVLCDFEWMRDESKTVNALMERLTELAQIIHYRVQQIGLALEDFNTLWFRTWRTLDVSDHLAAIKKTSAIIDETFELLKIMLPSCLILVRRKKVAPKQNDTLPEPACTTMVTTTVEDESVIKRRKYVKEL